MKKLTIGIYKIVNPIGEVYIGQSHRIEKRFIYHRNYKGPAGFKLANSLIKYSGHAHTYSIIHVLPSDVDQETLDRYEAFYIDQYRAAGYPMLNVNEGGIGVGHSKEVREKISMKNIGNKNHTGKKWSNEARQKASERQKGKKKPPRTEEHRRKLGEATKNRVMCDETKEKIRQASMGNKNMLGKPRSEETKAKLSDRIKELWAKGVYNKRKNNKAS